MSINQTSTSKVKNASSASRSNEDLMNGFLGVILGKRRAPSAFEEVPVEVRLVSSAPSFKHNKARQDPSKQLKQDELSQYFIQNAKEFTTVVATPTFKKEEDSDVDVSYITKLSKNELADVKKSDPFAYYSVPENLHAYQYEMFVEDSEDDSISIGHDLQAQANDGEDCVTKVTRSSRISTEVHPTMFFLDLFAED